MAGEIGLGLSFDLNTLNAQFKQADKRLEVFAESAEKQMKRVNEAFSLSATKGLSQLSKELENVYSKFSKLSGKNKITLRPTIDNSATAKIIDEVNKIVNYTRAEWEKLNAVKIGNSFFDPAMMNDIEKLSQRLSTLQTALNTGRLQEGDVNTKLTNAMRVKYADEIKAIEDRLKVLRMSTAEFNKLKAQEAANVIKNAQLEEDALKAEKKRLQDKIDAEKKAAEELAKIQSQRRASMYSRTQSTGIYYDKNGNAKDASKQAEAAFNRLYSDKGVMSVQKMNEVLSKLQASQQKLNLRTDEGKKRYEELGKKIKQVKQDLDKATGAGEKLNKTQQQLGDISKKLTNRVAALFSVQAITGYVKKVIEVRGEFEMQHRAMQTLIGDVDEANKLWDKTVSLAVKSPFRVRELVTYTKQLSAYRIEQDKLYDKTKMLADISAGLGVDMNRLILAYGQVKAANYLRGTELRQFSEAGINVLNELSKYFSELEGRAVSVGDVFERVSKRMVTFADVDAVLTRVTSEGGTFYQMQEKQSETLKGLMMNLSDSIDIMMNDLGKRNDSVLKITVGLLKDIIDNWRLIEPAIVAAGTALMVYFPLKKLGQIASSVKNIFTSVPKHPYALAIAGAAALAVGIYKVVTAQSKLNAELSEVDKNVSDELVDKIGLYKKLARTISDATTTTEEYEKAQNKLKTVFESILPDHMLEARYVKELADNYEDVEEAMLSYYNAKAIEQKKDKVRQKFTEDIDTNTSDLIIDINQAINRSRVISEKEKLMLLSGVSGAVNETISAIERGDIKPEDITKAIYERLEQYSGVDFTSVIASESSLFNAIQMGSNMNKLESLLRDRNKALERVEGLPFETYEQRELANAIEKEKELMASATQGYKNAVSIYAAALNELKKEGVVASDVWEVTNKKIEDTLKSIEDSEYKEKLVGIFETLGENAKKGSFEFNASLQSLEQNLLSGADGFHSILLSRFNMDELGTQAARDLLKNLQEELIKKGNKLKLNSFQDAVITGAKGISEKFNVDLDLFTNFIPQSEEALSVVSQELESYIKDWEQRIEKFNSSSSVEGYGVLAPDILTEKTSEIKKMEDALPALREFAKLLGIISKEPKKGKSDNLTDEQIRVIDNMNKKYRELKKTLTKGESIEGAFSAYKDAFEKAYKGTKFLEGKDMKTMTAEKFAKEILNFPDRNDIVRFLDELAELPKELDDKVRIELAKGGHVEEMNVEEIKKEQEKMLQQIDGSFDNYEISLELDKLNIPPDLAKRLFGVDAISLDDIRSEIEAKLTDARTVGGQEDYVKELEGRLEKVKELEDNQLKERLKTYTKYLVKEQHERIKFKMEEIRKLSEIDAMNEFNEDEKAVMKENIRRETNENMAKSYWEDFEKSPMFVNLFDDMELATKQSLNNMKTHLESMRDSMIAAGLPASDLKEILDKINQVEEELEERNPFKTIGEAFGIGNDVVSYKEFVKAKQEEVRLEEKLATLKASERDYIGNNETGEIGAIESTKQILANEEAFLAILPEGTEEYANQEEMVNNIREALAKLIHDHQKVTGEIQETNEELSNTQDKTKQWREQVSNSVGFFKQAQSAIDQIGGALSKTLGQFGMSEDNQAIFDSIQNVASDAMGLGADIGSLILNPLDVEAWVSAIANGISLIGNIAETGDAAKQKAINAELEKAKQSEKIYNDLVDKYAKLQKAMEKSFTIEQMNVNKKAMEQNMDAQSDSIDRQIAALEEANAIEADKKKTDQAAIDERNEQIEELRKQQEALIEQQEELDKQFVETMGGSYDYTSVAEQFLDAWLSAFEETGDGMKGLEDSFDDFWKNIIKKQVVYGGASQIMKKYLDGINVALENGVISESEQESLEKLEATVKENLNNFYKQMNDKYNLTDSETSLSGLQKSIQGITEDQAEILSAYWNSVRLDVSAIRRAFESYISAQSGTYVNPMLEPLKSIKHNTDNIYKLLDGVVGESSSGAGGVRVYVKNWS